jgi:two-component system OmpR family sensor kinase
MRNLSCSWPGYSPRVLIESRARSEEAETSSGAVERRSLLGGVRTRVLVSFLALLVVSTAASVLVLREVLLSRIGDQVVRELTQEVDALQDLSEAGQPPTGRRFTSVQQLFDAYLVQTPAPFDGALVTFAGGRLYRVKVADPAQTQLGAAYSELAAVSSPTSGELDTALGESRFVAIPVSIGETGGVVVAAALTASEHDQVESAVRIAIGVSVVVLLLASLFIWMAAGRAIAPLNALSRTARAISETDLSSRIPVQGGDEIAELGRTFNGMLDRLEGAFAEQKEFLSQVSHELRTPITVIRGNLETLGDSPRERAEATAVIQEELDRMSRYVDDLLLLAQAPRPDFLRSAPVDLDLFTHDLFAKARSLGRRDWRLDGTGVGIVLADKQRLTEAVMNLAENAVRFTDDGDAIWLGSSLVGDRVRLWVRDEGPGIEEADREWIFVRHARVETASDGLGLGLSIVQAIAEAHGGVVELDSSLGVGSTFTIVIPATAPPPS